MMKKQRIFQWIVWVVGFALALLLSPLNLKAVLPTGAFIAPLTTLFSFVGLLVLPWWSALLLLMIGNAGLMLMHASDLFLTVTMIIAFLIDYWLLDWHRAADQRYSQSQLITIGLVTGIISMVLLLILAWLRGVALLGSGSALNIVRLAFPVSLLTCLVYALLIPLVGSFVLWLRNRLFPPAAPKKVDGSVVIDLSDHQDKSNNDK